jgi:hypothetical protein
LEPFDRSWAPGVTIQKSTRQSAFTHCRFQIARVTFDNSHQHPWFCVFRTSSLQSLHIPHGSRYCFGSQRASRFWLTVMGKRSRASLAKASHLAGDLATLLAAPKAISLHLTCSHPSATFHWHSWHAALHRCHAKLPCQGSPTSW